MGSLIYKVYSKLLMKAQEQRQLSSFWCIFCELRADLTNPDHPEATVRRSS